MATSVCLFRLKPIAVYAFCLRINRANSVGDGGWFMQYLVLARPVQLFSCCNKCVGQFGRK